MPVGVCSERMGEGGGGRGEVWFWGGGGRLLVGGNWGIEDPRAGKDLGGRATEVI